MAAIASAAFIWDILPYAYGVTCEADKTCEELSLIQHVAATLAPLLIVLGLLFVVTKIKAKYSLSSIALLVIYPAIILGLLINAAI